MLKTCLRNIASQVKICSLNGILINVSYLEGGTATADVIQNVTSDFVNPKHVANIRNEDFIFETGLNDEIISVIKLIWNDGEFYLDWVFINATAALKATVSEDASLYLPT